MAAVPGTIAVDGGGNTQFTFASGSISSLTVNAGNQSQVNIHQLTPTSVNIGQASQNWMPAALNTASEAPGQVALTIDVTTDSNSSTTITVPGCDDPQHVDPGKSIRLIFINLHSHGVKRKFEVRREQR